MSLAADAPRSAAPLRAAADPRAFFAPFAGAAGFAISAFWPGLMREGDTWWHLAAGDWILAHHSAPHVDPFSFSMAGRPWVAHEWLSEVFMALAFRAAGWGGLALLIGLAFGATMAILARRLALASSDAVAALALVLVAALLTPSLTARPHMIALPLLALWADRLFAAREAGRAPPLWLALVLALWANLHGGFVFGLALVAPFALEAVVAAPAPERLRAALAWGRFGAVSLAGAMVTPFGFETLAFPFQLAGMRMLGRIGEWQAPDLSTYGVLPATLLGVLALALVTRARLGPFRVATLAALCAMSVAHARHETLLAVVGAMLLAPALGRLAERLSPAGAPTASSAWTAALPLAVAVAAARLLHPIERGEDSSSPVAAFAAVPESLRERHVLNDYNFGGYLIAHGVKPFVDGRADLYGDAFLERFSDLSSKPGALARELDDDAIAWTIFTPDRAIVSALDKEPGWRRLFANPTAVVHVRWSAGR